MARKSRSTEVITGTVSVETGGKTYTGSYTVRDRWMTVHTEYGTSKSAAVHEAPPGQLEINGLARLLMHEVIGEAMRDGRLKE